MYANLGSRGIKVVVGIMAVALIAAGSTVAWGASCSSSSSGRGAAHTVAGLPSGSTGVVTSALSATPMPDLTPLAAPTPMPTPKPLLARGVEASRDQIPWDQVGEGWSLALFSPAVRTNDGQQALYLMNAVGGRYRITTVSSVAYLSMWSSDSKMVTFDGYPSPPNPASSNLMSFDLDLVNGTAGSWHPTTKRLHPASAPDVGNISGDGLTWSDGSQYVLVADRGIALVSKAGRLVRTFPEPAGYSNCRPARWWEAGVVEITCSTQDGLTNVWSVPLDGRPRTQLTFGKLSVNGQSDGLTDHGYDGVWSTDFGRYATVAGCYPELVVMSDSGKGSPLNVPLPEGIKGGLWPVSIQRRAILFRISGCDSGIDSLVRYDLSTKRSEVILGPGLNRGSVGSVLPHPTDA